MAHNGSDLLAGFLEDRRDSLIDESFDALSSAGNSLLRQPEAALQVRRHYAQILSDVTASLRRGDVWIDESYSLLANEIGTARASAGVHPGESLQAGMTFYQHVLAATAELIAEHGLDPAELGLAALALQSSITCRVQEAFAGYTSFLLEKISVAQTEERRRIARDLHDRIGHSLSVAHHQLELSELYRQADEEKSTQKMTTAQRAVTDAMASLREVATGLHSARPSQNLRDTLFDAVREIDTAETDLRIRVNGEETWANPQVLEECTLVIREAGRNALNHARPSILAVNVDITPGEIRALIEDDGSGFDTACPSKGVGLSAMRERAELLGGSLAVVSRPGLGTRVSFFVPLGGVT